MTHLVDLHMLNTKSTALRASEDQNLFPPT